MRRDNIIVWRTVSVECFGHSWKDLKKGRLSIDWEMDDTLMWSSSTWISILIIPAFWIQHLSSDESLATLANYMIKVHYEFRWSTHEMRTNPRFWELSKVITGFSRSFPCLHRIEPYSWQAKQAPVHPKWSFWFSHFPFVMCVWLCVSFRCYLSLTAISTLTPMSPLYILWNFSLVIFLFFVPLVISKETSLFPSITKVRNRTFPVEYYSDLDGISDDIPFLSPFSFT